MPVHVSYVTDPACPASWAMEPTRRRLLAEFGDEVAITYVMSGFARQFERPLDQLAAWLDAGERSGMPVDPRLWLDAPPKSSYPACLAVKAAAEQGRDGALLRRLREGFAVEGRRLDTPDALLGAAAEVDGIVMARFEVDLRSNAIVEAFGTDIDRARSGSSPRWEVEGTAVEETALLEAVRAAAAASSPLPSVEEALRTFGRMTVAEIAAVCDLPGPRAPAELWRLASEWRARPDRVPSARFFLPG